MNEQPSGAQLTARVKRRHMVTHPQLMSALERPQEDQLTTTSPSSFAVPPWTQENHGKRAFWNSIAKPHDHGF